jgi:hypothetical protein
MLIGVHYLERNDSETPVSIEIHEEEGTPAEHELEPYDVMNASGHRRRPLHRYLTQTSHEDDRSLAIGRGKHKPFFLHFLVLLVLLLSSIVFTFPDPKPIISYSKEELNGNTFMEVHFQQMESTFISWVSSTCYSFTIVKRELRDFAKSLS